VVDYTIESENALINILYYKISEFNPTLSDCHCKLEWEMCANYSLTPTSSEDCSMHPIPLRYIWSEDSTSAFQEALSSSALQLQIDHFLSKTNIHILTLQRLNWPIFLLMQLISLLKSLKKTTKLQQNITNRLIMI
jgi:hypothetical protein